MDLGAVFTPEVWRSFGVVAGLLVFVRLVRWIRPSRLLERVMRRG